MSIGEEVAGKLQKVIAEGFDIHKVSKEAFCIYQDQSLSLSSELDTALLTLFAMEQGPEFEMSEGEVLDLLSKIRSI